MPWHFWRRFPRRSGSSTAAKALDSSAVARESGPPFVAELDRRASRYSLLETIAAFIVVAGVLAEDWNEFFKFYAQPNWAVGRVALGGIAVAFGIVLELWFGSRSAKAERKIRDWYSLRVAELNLKAEQERHARLKIPRGTAKRTITATERVAIVTKLSEFSGSSPRVCVAVGVMNDLEALGFAGAIMSALMEAKPTVAGIFQAPTGAIWRGLYMSATNDEESQRLGAEIAGCLNDIGVKGSWLDGIDSTNPEIRKLWPPGTYDENTKTVLIVVRELPIPDLSREILEN